MARSPGDRRTAAAPPRAARRTAPACPRRAPYGPSDRRRRWRRREPPEQGEPSDRGRRGRERDVVARPRAPQTRRAARAREAAHLERGRDVHRAVERAADHRTEQRHAAARPARGALRTGPLRLGQALGVRREHGNHARGQRRGQRRAERQPAEHPQQLVGVDREAGERRDEDQQRHLQRDHDAVDERLDGQIALAERPEIAEPREHGQPVAGDEHVDEHDRHGHDQRGPQRARELAAHAGAGPRCEHAPRAAPAAASGWKSSSVAAVSASAHAAPTPARVACSGLAMRR